LSVFLTSQEAKRDSFYYLIDQEQNMPRKKKLSGFTTATSTRFDAFSLNMVDRIVWDEFSTRPQVIREAVKALFIKKYGIEEFKKMREKNRGLYGLNEEEEEDSV
jgi:hypothetical protein